MNWIPITAQTPPPYTKLLLTVRDTEWSREEGYHEVERVVCKVWNGDKRAIAWQNLPEPYHAENKEKEDTTDYPLGYNPYQE